jgi:hypothetical protein
MYGVTAQLFLLVFCQIAIWFEFRDGRMHSVQEQGIWDLGNVMDFFYHLLCLHMPCRR